MSNNTLNSNVLNIAATDPTAEQAEKLKELNEAMVINSNDVMQAADYIEYLRHKKTKTMYREHKKINRNDLCPCGSGKKYKKCCLESAEYEKYTDEKQ